LGRILAIYDSDGNYAARLMEYFIKQEKFPFEVLLFTKRESLMEYLSDNKLFLLLVNEELYTEDLNEDRIHMICILSEYQEKSKQGSPLKIFKYQPAKAILNTIAEHCLVNERNTTNHSESSSNLITLFTPALNFEKICFAWSFALGCSTSCRTLFIPLEAFPVPTLLNIPQDHLTFSEFLYYLKENNPNLKMKLKSSLNQKENLTYLYGISHGLDLYTLNREDIQRWLEVMKNHLGYECIIILAGVYSEAVVEIIKQSERVLLPETEQNYEDAVLDEWGRQMQLYDPVISKEKYQRIILSTGELKKGLSLSELPYTGIWNQAGEQLKKLFAEGIWSS
jgi:hypothetical protein